MESMLIPAHLLILLLGALCISGFVVCIVLMVVYFVRKRNQDDNALLSLKEENDRLKEEIEKLKRTV